MKKIFSFFLAICLLAGLLPLVANAASGPAKVSIVAGELNELKVLEVSEGGEAKYMVTVNGFATTENASASNYNIKLEFPTGQKPTLSLKGATLKSGNGGKYNIWIGEGPEEYVIKVEEDSTIESTETDKGACIYMNKRSLTVTGPGKLNLNVKNSSGIVVYQEGISTDGAKHDLTFDHVNIEMDLETEKATCFGFGRHVKSLNVIGGNIKAKAAGAAMFYSWSGEMNVTGNAQMDLTTAGSKNLIEVESQFTMDSGHLKIRKEGGASVKISKPETGKIIIKGGTIDQMGGAFTFGPAPDFSEYTEEHSIIVSQTPDGTDAMLYDHENAVNDMKATYFQLVKGARYSVKVLGGTADKYVAAKGETVTLTARKAREGQQFVKWEINSGKGTLANPNSKETTLTIEDENVKVTAVFKKTEEDTSNNDTNNNTNNDTNNNTNNDTNNTNNDTNNNTNNDTNNNTNNDTNNNTNNDTNNTNNDTNNNTNKPDDDNKGDDKKPATKKNGGTVLLIVIIVVLVLGTGAAVAIIMIKAKAQDAEDTESEEGEETEEPEATEESAE